MKRPSPMTSANLKMTTFVMEVGLPPSQWKQRGLRKCKLGSARALSITAWAAGGSCSRALAARPHSVTQRVGTVHYSVPARGHLSLSPPAKPRSCSLSTPRGTKRRCGCFLLLSGWRINLGEGRLLVCCGLCTTSSGWGRTGQSEGKTVSGDLLET